MKQPTRFDRAESPAEISDHMADALAYLCQVARDANLNEILADLVLIHQRLVHAVPPTGKAPNLPGPKIELGQTTSGF